jgi:hypothetical protein
MLTQLFRAKIFENRRLKIELKSLDDYLIENSGLREDQIVTGLANEWQKKNRILLSDSRIGNNLYHFFIDFSIDKTHGAPYLDIEEDYVDLPNGKINYKTEFGDLAILVEYWFDNTLLSRKLSVLQTKKEKIDGTAEINLHQLYLMNYWPSVTIKGKSFTFDKVNADIFSFYHFILTKSNARYAASVCSAPFVSLNVSKNKADLENDLSAWSARKKVNKNEPYPCETLHMPLVPGQISSFSHYDWNKIPAPFYNFLFDAAYQNLGTDDSKVLEVASLRIPTKLSLRVSGAKEFDNYRQDKDLCDQRPC